MTKFLLDFTSAYIKGYSTNYILLRLIENWKATLDSNLFTRAVLMDSSTQPANSQIACLWI